MASIRLPENIAKLAKASSTTVTLPASRINIGGQQYVTTGPLTLSTATIGAGGVDASVQSGKLYYTYAVVSNSIPALVASTNSSLPSGFTQARLVGHFFTDASSNVDVVFYSGQYDSEVSTALSNDLNNLIINGNMDFSQRGTTISIPSSASYKNYTADRFALGKDTSGNGPTYTQSTDVPTFAQSGFASKFSLLLTAGAASTFAAGDGMFVNYKIEGQDYQFVHGKRAKIQFWVKSSIAGTYGFLLNSNASLSGGRGYATTYTINNANTWEKKSVDIQLENSGAYNFDNSAGLMLMWSLGAGTSVLTSTTNTWANSNAEGVVGQVNWAATAGATFQLSQVAMYAVSAPGVDLPFFRSGKSIQGELAKCQRYYEFGNCYSTGEGTNSNVQAFEVIFKVTKRAAANLFLPSSFSEINGAAAFPNTTTATTIPAEGGQSSVYNPSGGATINYKYRIGNWIADAEL